MARYAQVAKLSRIVVNVIEWDGDTAKWTPPAGYDMVEDTDSKAGPGFSYDGTTFTPPPGGQPGTGT